MLIYENNKKSNRNFNTRCILNFILHDDDDLHIFLLPLRWPKSRDMWSMVFPLLDAVVSKYHHRWHTDIARGLPYGSVDESICLASLNAYRKLVWMIYVYKDHTHNNMAAARMPC
jgi:hypothetical protein